MLTPEQIKKLKPGDKLALSHPLIFREYDSENDELLAINNGEYIYFHAVDVELPSEHGTSVPTPKHDPCRLFRKGDRVKTRSVFGRKIYIDDVLYEVIWDESCNKISVKDLTSAETLVGMPSVFFELVTPVEEIEPYSVEESCGGANLHCFILKRRKKHLSYYLYKAGNANHYYTREQAKAAAEAERDRLNAEWRKEQK